MKRFTSVLFRIIALPFLFGFVFIYHMRMVFSSCFNFVLYGGEWLSHTKLTGPWVTDVLDYLKTQVPQKEN